MLKVIIIEDEEPARQQLLSRLQELPEAISTLASLRSVQESRAWLATHEAPDLVFSDVQLEDGLSFSIFDQLVSPVPVIFITGYDHFMLQAFDQLGIDYLLKPVSTEKLQKALQRFRLLEKHFSTPSVKQLLNTLLHNQRKRFPVRKGTETLMLKLDDIVLFYSENKLVYLIDQSGNKFLADGSLGEIARTLDTRLFFRANRQYIINVNFIRSFKTFERVKLLLELNIPVPGHQVVISQETAPVFRNWMHNA